MASGERFGIILCAGALDRRLAGARLMRALARHWQRRTRARALILAMPADQVPARPVPGWSLYPGETDQLARLLAAARRHKLTAVLRLTPENLLLPDELLARALKLFRSRRAPALVTAGFPRGLNFLLARVTALATLPPATHPHSGLAARRGTLTFAAQPDYLNLSFRAWTGRGPVIQRGPVERVPELDLRPGSPLARPDWLAPRSRPALAAMITAAIRRHGRQLATLYRKAPAQPAKRSLLLVNHTAIPGGAELSLLSTARGLAARGWQVRLLLLADGPLVRLARAAEIPVQVEPGDLPAAARRLRLLSLLRAFRPGLLYTNSAPATAAILEPALAENLPVVAHIREFLDAATVHASGLAACRAVIANSKATAAHLAAFLPAVKVIPNGMDPVEVRARAATEVRTPCEKPLIGLFGRFAPYKGQHTALAALARLRRQLPHAHLLLAGDSHGLPGGEGYADWLRAQVKKLRLTGRVTFAGHCANPYPYMAACDIIIIPTQGEPFGRVVLEALALGKPVIATTGSGPAELLPAAWLVPPDDPAALARKVIAWSRGKMPPVPAFPRRCLPENYFRQLDLLLTRAAPRS